MQNADKDPKVAEAMRSAAGMDWLKIKIEPAGKGDAGEVAGLGAEVDLYTMKFEVTGNAPSPMAAKALGSQTMKIAYWTAPMPPSFAEMGAAQLKFMNMFSSASNVTKQGGNKQSPANFAEPFKKLQEEYTQKGRFMVKMVMETYMDFAAMGVPAPPELERLGSEPMMTITIETRSFSDDALDPKLFVVPAGFDSVKLEDLDLSGLVK
jgi:hypothetical protein